MLGRIVEIADNNRHLSVYRGFLVVKATDGDKKELGRIPCDDICALIVNAYGVSYTNNVLIMLAEKGAPFVLCANNHNAIGMLWPIGGNFEVSKRIDAQINAKLPLKKRLWAELIKNKIAQQANVLRAIEVPDKPLSALVSKVRSGDPDNVEAQAARRYWTLLFGKDFRRDRRGEGANALLNYGYTILRATVARAVIAAGLHPSIGIHHSNASNPMRLVDDLIEPFRPYVDYQVYQLLQEGVNDVNPDSKRQLARLMYEDLVTEAGMVPITVCAQKLAVSLAQVYLGEREKLELPLIGAPIILGAIM
ncbi:type II CRISPR-associated endonuclease Cas1 [Pelistega suis]|uniref:CRISPR-associated endonuclease Cas1 n=2 Tax=Pelistega suis TaxID=1631957 RepID=A0A849P1E9_9BURK|nr:type II CRISPR-associated endonuclease Cas1 [Pelistega suis]